MWLPVRTMALMAGEESRDLSARLRSAMRGVKRALRALGRWSSTVVLVRDWVLRFEGREWEGTNSCLRLGGAWSL